MDFDLGGSTTEAPKEPAFNIMDLMAPAMAAFNTGDWGPVMEKVKPFIAPAIGESLINYDKAGNNRIVPLEGIIPANCSYIITKKADVDGNLMVFLSVIERPVELNYILDAEGDPIVKEVGDLLDLILKK
jgi:hypothetical protein